MTPVRRVVSIGTDLFFSEKIAAASRAAGVALVSLAPAAALERCAEAPTALVLIDLHASGDPLGAARALRADARTASVPLVGFYSHVQTELRDAALAAGIDLVLPRSAFVARLAGLLRGEGDALARRPA